MPNGGQITTGRIDSYLSEADVGSHRLPRPATPGFLLIVVDLDDHAWQSFVADPPASSHPYETAALPR